jgi:hypothetical protein
MSRLKSLHLTFVSLEFFLAFCRRTNKLARGRDDACQVQQFEDQSDYYACNFDNAKIVDGNVFDSWPAEDQNSVFGKSKKKRAKKAFFGCEESCQNGDRIVVKLPNKKFHKPKGKEQNSCVGVTSEDKIKTIDMSKGKKTTKGKGKGKKANAKMNE